MPVPAHIDLLNIIYIKIILIALVSISVKFEETVLILTDDKFIIYAGKIFLWIAVICSTLILITTCVNIALSELCEPISNIIRIVKDILHDIRT